MPKMPFYKPVCVSFPDESVHIEDIEQALRFLRSWPADRRGPVYRAAFNACTAVQEGYLTVEEARKSLTGFARITGILKQDQGVAPRRVPGVGSRITH